MSYPFTFPALLRAWKDCRRGKLSTGNCLEFEINAESELVRLERELTSHIWRPGRSICFVVEKPKLREIFAAGFRDRVVHHLLINRIGPVFEPLLSPASFACRKDKGTHRAAGCLQRFLLEPPPTGCSII